MKASLHGRLELRPGEGLGDLRLGMTRAEVHALFGPGEAGGKQERFASGAVLVEFRAGRVAFVEASAGGRVRPDLFGTSVFQTRADAMIDMLRRRRVPVHEDEPGTLFVARELQLAFWREGDPDSLRQEIANLDAADPEQRTTARVLRADIRRFEKFGTVATFVKDYYGRRRNVPAPKAATSRAGFSLLLQGAMATSRNVKGGKRLTDRAILESIVEHRGNWKPAVVSEARRHLETLCNKP